MNKTININGKSTQIRIIKQIDYPNIEGLDFDVFEIEYIETGYRTTIYKHELEEI